MCAISPQWPVPPQACSIPPGSFEFLVAGSCIGKDNGNRETAWDRFFTFRRRWKDMTRTVNFTIVGEEKIH